MLTQSWLKTAVLAASLGVAATAYASETITYSYDSRGRLVKVEHADGVNDGVTTQYSHDKADNRANVTVTGGASVIMGTAGGDNPLNGTTGSDAVFGLGGNDWIHLHDGGNDRAYGGDGNDLIFFRGTMTAADTVDGGAEADQIVLQGNYAGGLTLGSGIVGIEGFSLLSASDTRFSGNGAGPFIYSIVPINQNVYFGQTLSFEGTLLGATETFTFDGAAETDGAFSLFGGQGADTLAGGAGADVLQGSLGADALTGRGGNDTFKFRTANDSTAASTDTISDFTTGDIIHLSVMDANSTVGGDQAFSFIGSSAFSSTAGQLRAQVVTGAQWLVQGDVDGNGTADFSLTLTSADAHTLTSSDFVL